MSMMTTSQPTVPLPDPGWIPSPLYRMSVDQYEAMVASGGLGSRQRFHLINGYLVEKMTLHPPHRVADGLCGDALARIIPAGRYHVAASQPVRLPAQASMPEPDRSVVRGTVRDYEDHHPGPIEVPLIAEVSDTSLADDRKMATEVYGPAGIPVYWIVNLVHRQVEVYTRPGPQGYASTEVFTEGQSVPVVIDGQELGRIAVADILPSRAATPRAGA